MDFKIKLSSTATSLPGVPLYYHWLTARKSTYNIVWRDGFRMCVHTCVRWRCVSEKMPKHWSWLSMLQNSEGWLVIFFILQFFLKEQKDMNCFIKENKTDLLKYNFLFKAKGVTVAAFLGEEGKPIMDLVTELPPKVFSFIWASVMYWYTALTLGNG